MYVYGSVNDVHYSWYNISQYIFNIVYNTICIAVLMLLYGCLFMVYIII